MNFTSHAEAVQAIVAMNGQPLSNKMLKCSWGRHQPRQSSMFAMDMLQMQSQPGFLGSQNMLGSINPMLQLPAGMHLANRPTVLGQIQMPLPQHAQQLQQPPPLMHAQQPLQIAPQLNSPQHNLHQQMLAAQAAQMETSSSLYFNNMYGGLYGAQ